MCILYIYIYIHNNYSYIYTSTMRGLGAHRLELLPPVALGKAWYIYIYI